MALEIVDEMPILGITNNGKDLRDIPSDLPIKELRIDYFNTTANVQSAGEDPFLMLFQDITVQFESKEMYKLESVMDLINVHMTYYGTKPEIIVQQDTDTGDADVVKMSFKLPVYWTPDQKTPQLKINYSADAGTFDDGDGTLSIRYVQTRNTAGFRRFVFKKDEKSAGTNDTKDFNPLQGSTVRGAYIRAIDQITDLYNGGSRFSLGAINGALEIAQTTFRHQGVKYFDEASERDVLQQMRELYRPTNVYVPIFDDANNPAGSGDAFDPRNLFVIAGWNEGTGTAGVVGNPDPQSFLYMTMEDIVSDANTLLRFKTGASNWTTGDLISILWVYVDSIADVEIQGA